ncbi:FAD-dependent monooxygenase [Pseudomonas sichuanensis]|uniref:FAD-dependent monooxygenase n=1 Tax=Pseudomonas sichuanensis TaxID=2213015 RepID=UPI00244A71C6|nr:FAD-dependent monooxygenase [Pseudomonas sichuanensis]MDH0730195.1 FAD-dependent monooxygenase [Pseudomonas sichuanensis]MDH1581221.1 FAD-dependent monooxygenase [Pseudomonas sichuanensis]MDH1593382.1 FAD-dependent monooxygenase [Pseudomonas sichuanensis]MDH1597137.1 FAD-dependent monooxygenase [Pseudomonas sichuanensis]
MSKSVLISGAGIAGSTLGYWLNKFGYRVTIIERSPIPRLTGQTVDIRDEGRDVISRMGILDRIEHLMTNESGLRFVDDDNTVRAEHPRAGGKKSFVTDIEILRADLCNILLDATNNEIEYIYGDSITSYEERNEKVDVSFKNNPGRQFDLVFIAEGMRSRTRELVFGHVPVHHIGLYTAYFAIPYEQQDGNWVRWHNCLGGKSVLLRPDRQKTSRAYLYIRSNERDLDLKDRSEVMRFIQNTFENDGWEVPRIIEGLRHADDLYFEDLGQIKMKSWSRGRVAILGDAAYCATPISGMGTTLAIVGAYLLARSLLENSTHAQAFCSYENKMRPYVKKAQAYNHWTIRLEQPDTKSGINFFYTLKRIDQHPAINLVKSLFNSNKYNPDLLGDESITALQATQVSKQSRGLNHDK